MSVPYAVSGALSWLWPLLGLACLAGAAAALDGTRLAKAERWLEESRVRRPALAVGAATSVLVIGAAFKLAQYSSFQLMDDSAALTNLVWNFAHGHGLTSSVFGGRSYLSIHFAFAAVLLVPLLRLWPSPLVLVLAHALAVGTAPIAAFLLARTLTGREAWAWLAGLLAFSAPQFHWTWEAVLDNSVYALPAFLWAAYFWETGRLARCAVCVAVLAMTREQAPCLFFGFGPYILMRDRSRRGVLTAASVMAGSLALWCGEMAVVAHAKADLPGFFDQWSLYRNLGGSAPAVARALLARPWLLFWEAVHPLGKCRLVALTLLQCGPLLWASIVGLARLLKAKGGAREPLLAAWLLAVSGANFLRCETVLLPRGSFPSAWDTAAPAALAEIPADAKVWCDPYLSPQLGARRYLKILWLEEDASFDQGFFAPDRVLLSTHWLARAQPAFRDRVVGFLRARRYAVVFREADLVVFAAPQAPALAALPR